ncbi:GATA transcription factor 28-like isoform X2 [Papaver somniferum]|uniref:GATA transcription factor 28-like isoform X2 n=1 Tax=Papaver somniferum TaxID=3469 RepID=UPI000E6FC4DB|nr:GATA transcription factor 28-like isoform X2 [Papaver somniferum]
MNPKLFQSFPFEDEFENEVKSPFEIGNDDDDDDDYEEEENEEGYEDDDESTDDDYEEENTQVNSRRKVESSTTTDTNNDATVPLVSRHSELTISFEGELYVFHSVTYQKVQAVLLLLGARHEPIAAPSVETSFYQHNKGSGDDAQQHSNISGRTASVVRFQKKRKELCFEKKTRYNCRKEVAKRMHRKKGQFVSLRENHKEGSAAASGWDNIQSFPQNNRNPPKIARCKCQHCGVDETSTPAMRRGPAGPRSLCNACGLMWASKGTLRDLSKGRKNPSYDKNEQNSLAQTEVLSMESESAPSHSDDQGSPENLKPSPYKIASPAIPDKERIPDCGMVAQSLWGDLRALSSNFWDLQGTPNDLSRLSAVGVDLHSHLNEQLDANGSIIASYGQGL